MNITIPKCNLLQNIPYDKFWETVEHHKTPIIEQIDNNNEFVQVTFIYKAQKDTNNVVLATYGLCSYDPKQDQLEHISNTDIFYRTYVFPKKLKTIYCLSPNDALLNLADSDLYDCDLMPMIKTWEQDRFNPKTYTLPGWLVFGDVEKKFSILQCPDAVDCDSWSQQNKNVTPGEISQHTVNGKYINLSRNINIYKPSIIVPQNYVYPLITFFDGDAYLEFTAAAIILDNLIAAEKIPPVMAAFISNPPPNTVTRWADLTCNENYTNFIAQDLIPWVHNNFPISKDPKDNVIAGASFGGLASMFLAYNYPKLIGNIISQSGAFFWRPEGEREDGWLMKLYSLAPRYDLKIVIDVGCVENALTFNKSASILSGNRHMRDVLNAKGYSVFYQEYSGGHEYLCWQDTLPSALIHIFA